jgi:Ribbon-helix-helix protein, copG family
MAWDAAYDARGRHSNTPIVSVRVSSIGATVSRSSTARARCRANVNSAGDRSVGGVSARLMGKLGDRAIMGYHMEAKMTDMLIRDVPEEVVAAVDAHAARLGLSRSEYVRRRLAQDAATPGSPVSVEDLARFAATFADLANPDVMSQAWT